MYRKVIKRFLDIFISLILLIILSPLFLFLAILIRTKLGSPVLFSQERAGRNGKSFLMYKFRTMSDERDQNGVLLPDELRMTAFGNKIRSLSIDELPELLSILKGDMSFIGPRPLPVSYMAYLKPEERVIHTVRGGLIPPDCLSCKTMVSWDEQFAYESEYAGNVSFVMDIKILLATLNVLLKRVESDYGAEIREALPVCRKGLQDEHE